MSDWVRVAAVGECPPGSLLGVQAGRWSVVLANVDGDLYALEDRCSHQDFPLSDGELSGSTLTCTYHGATFDACTGRATGLPALRPVKSFPVEVRDDGVFVDVA